ncbi:MULTISPECIES: hypothetical protein [Ramlibacter]|jgi:hypothetical protein|uniref:DUF2782 domain-containing protein n=1 Tax=Ramlibacter pinisoli TaxID=2682844 RepID=A0A6N8IY73_9BURK|nr:MULTISPECIES: hypothetical protein [Ramlibacter]MBA2961612.1 hypothetical protein [Ramlibacter sp. CGMCC 1.13660]MVQ31555.1 hypothetical protein [Ramlibacter pinisoli]
MSRLVPLLLLLLAGAAQAQQQRTEPPLPGRSDQRIERMTHEDAGSRVDEVRMGGQTESITVQPKGGAPSYTVDPANLKRSRPGDQRNGLSSAGGQPSWSVLRF